MALLDFLKRKKQTAASGEPRQGREKAKKPAKVSVVKETKPVETKAQEIKVKQGSFSYQVIRNPHISEKASYLAEKDQYVFEIAPRGFNGRAVYPNKKEIKDAIEGIYRVNVLFVNTIKIPSKKRRLGRTEGFRKSYKKAVVKIKEGQKIEIL